MKKHDDEDSLLSSIMIEHSTCSSVDLVGLQVWRGALLLADFIMCSPDLFQDHHVLELAAGTGLTSVTAGLFAKSVTATDVDRGELFENILMFYQSMIFRRYSTIDEEKCRTEQVIIDQL